LPIGPRGQHREVYIISERPVQYTIYWDRMLSKVNYKKQQRWSPSYNYVGVHILLICGKHLHDCINSLRGEVWAHKSSLTPPLFLEVSVPSQESGRSSICVSGFDFCLFLRLFWLDFGNVSTVWYFFFILYLHITLK